jgi:hypothetical protein
MNSFKVKKYAEIIFEPFMKDQDFAAAFYREFSYKKGKINYFDPDFEGKINLLVDAQTLKFNVFLSGFKDKLYMRVMMVMYKKLLRFLIILDMIMNVMHRRSGKVFVYDIEFVFRYG